MIRVGIVGGTGKLGSDIIRLLMDHNEITLGAVIARKINPFVGKDVGSIIDKQNTDIRIQDDVLGSREKCDVYIDCTNADSFINNYEAYVLSNKPVIIATTGFDSKQMRKIHELAESIPVVICPNFCIGVYKFLKLIRLAAIEYGLNADIDIFEYHHKHKKDKPSGTAMAIASTIRDTGREEHIHLHSVRAGNIIGEHSILFTNDNERIEISHKIYSREGFSRGVIETIKWMIHQEAGLFGIEDIIR